MTPNDTPIDKKAELSAKQRAAALCLARGFTIVKTAAEVGVADITIDRWKRKPDFLAAIRTAEDELYSENLRALKKASGAAIATLLDCMQSKVSAYVRVQSASKILDLAIEVHRLEGMQQEIDELKAALADAID